MKIKKVLLGALAVVMTLLLTSCGQPKLTESRIREDIRINQTLMISGKLELEKVQIERQQHNEKNEVLYCSAVFGNKNYQVILYLYMNYDFYDEGGWYLADFHEYQDRSYSVRSGVSEELIEAQIRDDYGPNAQYEILEHTTNLEERSDHIKLRVWEDGSVLSYEDIALAEWRVVDNSAVWTYWGSEDQVSYTFHDIEGDWYLDKLGTGILRILMTIHDAQWGELENSVTVSYQVSSVSTLFESGVILEEEKLPLQIEPVNKYEPPSSLEGVYAEKYTTLSFVVQKTGGEDIIYILPDGVYLYNGIYLDPFIRVYRTET